MKNTSILNDIKHTLGIIDEEVSSFDTDLIMDINSVFSILHQMGVGPDKVFQIEDSSATWNDFIQNDDTIAAVKTYIRLKVKMMFDTPSNGSVINSYNAQISELETRLYTASGQY